MPFTNGNLRQICSPSTSAARFACSLRSTGIWAWKGRRLHHAAFGVVESLEELARDAHALRDHAARVAGMDPFGQHLDAEHAVDEPPQRRRAPELVVVAAARVQPDDQVGRADARRERLEVGREVVAAALLAAFDEDRHARVRPLLLLQRAQRRQGAEHRVAVVRAAPAVELAALDHRRPRPEPFAPAGHFGLLVEVAVDQHIAFAFSFDFDVQHWSADLQAAPLPASCPAPRAAGTSPRRA
jgi:hypothetical protein